MTDTQKIDAAFEQKWPGISQSIAGNAPPFIARHIPWQQIHDSLLKEWREAVAWRDANPKT